MQAKYKVGDYIRWNIAGSDIPGGGNVEVVTEQNGRIIYTVSAGNGAASRDKINEDQVVTLLNG